jgi:hypothetical protein
MGLTRVLSIEGPAATSWQAVAPMPHPYDRGTDRRIDGAGLIALVAYAPACAVTGQAYSVGVDGYRVCSWA